ncbi:MAG: O-antigen ligase family protein [Patulibacter sp.]
MAYAIGSIVVLGDVADFASWFRLLDNYSVVAFLFFVLAPWAFDTHRRQRVFLASLMIVAAYLGFTGVMEGLGLREFVFPRYISDPAVGIHYGRARGPFVSSVPMGSALAAGVVLSVLAVREWRNRVARVAIGLTASLCVVGVMFTLTRGCWVALPPALVVTLLLTPGGRRWLLPTGVVGLLAVVALPAVVPGFREKADERATQSASVWERENTNASALRMIADRPLTGVGWGRYLDYSKQYARQPDDLPMYGSGVAVHNVMLGLLSEGGFLGLTFWLLAYLACIVLPALRAGPPRLRAWQGAALGVCAVVIINGLFAPANCIYSMHVAWALAGIVYCEQLAHRRRIALDLGAFNPASAKPSTVGHLRWRTPAWSVRITRPPALMILPVLTVGAGAVAGYLSGPKYIANANVGVGDGGLLARTDGYSYAAKQVAATLARGIAADAVIEPAAQKLGITPAELRERVSATPIPDTTLVRVTAAAPQADAAVQIANAVAVAFAEHITKQAAGPSPALELKRLSTSFVAVAKSEQAKLDALMKRGKANNPAYDRAAAALDESRLRLRAGISRYYSAFVHSNVIRADVVGHALSARPQRRSRIELGVGLGFLVGMIATLCLAERGRRSWGDRRTVHASAAFT